MNPHAALFWCLSKASAKASVSFLKRLFARKRSFLHSVCVFARLTLDHCTLTNLPSDYTRTHTLAQNVEKIFLTCSLCLKHIKTILLNTIITKVARNRIKTITVASNKVNFPIMHKFKSFTVVGMRTI